jgi:hypothetical protein
LSSSPEQGDGKGDDDQNGRDETKSDVRDESGMGLGIQMIEDCRRGEHASNKQMERPKQNDQPLKERGAEAGKRRCDADGRGFFFVKMLKSIGAG